MHLFNDHPTTLSRRDFLKTCGMIGSAAYLALREESSARTLPLYGNTLTLASPEKNANGHYWIIPIESESTPSNAQTVHGYPGSIMKLIDTTVLLENNAFNPNLTVDCRGRTRATIKGLSLNCSHAHGRVSLSEALAVSCNAYFASALHYIEPQSFSSAWHAFFPRSKLRPPPTRFTLPGYVFGCTPATEVSAADLLKIMQWLARQENHKTNVQNHAMSSHTRQVLLQGMRSAARWGTGKQTDPEDRYRLALKTGTTRHGNTYQSWVVGFFPFDAPKFVFCCRGNHGTSEDSAIPLLRKALSTYTKNR